MEKKILHARCDVYWYVEGNGYLMSNTPSDYPNTLTSNEERTLMPLSESMAWYQLWHTLLPEELRVKLRGIRDIFRN